MIRLNAPTKRGPTLPKTGLMIRLNTRTKRGPTHSKTRLTIRLNALKIVVLPPQNMSDDQARNLVLPSPQKCLMIRLKALTKRGSSLARTGLMIGLNTWSYRPSPNRSHDQAKCTGNRGPTLPKTGLMIRLKTPTKRGSSLPRRGLMIALKTWSYPPQNRSDDQAKCPENA